MNIPGSADPLPGGGELRRPVGGLRFCSSNDGVEVVYRGGSGQRRGVPREEMGSAAVENRSDSSGDEVRRSIHDLKEPALLVVEQRLRETLDTHTQVRVL
ncbi:hypothetical protein EYF80_004092 [Liparis tanakae]|uniref:Uncharacterized protein n=1 Tax=Liparis tanakae TaxID=230148 RepID=A0A4Z2J5L1_9TELE|nr:hypothetical protein EYF80_004092 [Liparis tanakae]